MIPTRLPVRLPLLLACASLAWACSVDRSGLSATAGLGGNGAMDGGSSAGADGGAGAGGTTGVGGGTGGDGGTGGGGAGGGAGGGGTGGSLGCGPSTCPNGCCMDADTCVTNLTAQLCGTAGEACGSCDPCYRCSAAGACELDPGARWDVVCGSASITATKPGGAAWDTGPGMMPAPDPFCQLTLNGVVATRTISSLNTLLPMWNASIGPTSAQLTEDVLSSQGTWAIAVFDDDMNQMIFEPICTVSPALTPDDFAAGTVTFQQTQSCINLSVRLTCAAP